MTKISACSVHPAYALALLALASCGDTGQDRVTIDLYVQGTSAQRLEVGAATYVLTRATIAFGPAYFCATEGAEDELCEVALAELTDSVAIDGLSGSEARAGRLDATTGTVHSALYDYGISWFLTQSAPEAGDEAPGGHSAVLEGTVARGGETLRFVTRIDVEPRGPGDAAVNAARTTHEIRGGERLTVRVDPYAWLRLIDVDELFALDTDGDGQAEIDRGAQAYEAILQAMQNGAPVAFLWSN